MRSLTLLFLTYLFILGLSGACVDSLDLNLQATVDVIVIDGVITNLPEAQRIRLNRSQTDFLTSWFGFKPLTQALVEVPIDSSLVVTAHETDVRDNINCLNSHRTYKQIWGAISTCLI